MSTAPPQIRRDFSFPHHWQAEILPARPAILPALHFTYPRDAEEIERGALEVLIRPHTPDPDSGTWETATGDPQSHTPQSFLATCALGFRDPAAPTGLWSAPHPNWLCAVSGGYAYLIDTTAPERFTMLPFRPVLDVRAALADSLLLFVSHHKILAWGREGRAWESEKVSDEGVTISSLEPGLIRGLGWEMQTDQETAFALNISNGRRIRT